jgi:hypothetical protein
MVIAKMAVGEAAVSATLAWLREHELPRQVVFCCFDDADAEVYRARLDQLAACVG